MRGPRAQLTWKSSGRYDATVTAFITVHRVPIVEESCSFSLFVPSARKASPRKENLLKSHRLDTVNCARRASVITEPRVVYDAAVPGIIIADSLY